MRLNKYIALCSDHSRRSADELITSKRVTINGKIADIGMQVENGDKVCIDGVLLTEPEEKIVIAFNKPVGVVVTKKDEHADVVIDDLIDYPVSLTYAGRLDKDSEGLILLSNDGDFINNLMKGSHKHEKEYIVKINKPAIDKDVRILRDGIYLSGLEVKTRPCKITRLGENEFSMILTQGLNRQIRRMWAELGYKVISLKRVRIENIMLGNLPVGKYRKIEDKELTTLYEVVGMTKEKR